MQNANNIGGAPLADNSVDLLVFAEGSTALEALRVVERRLPQQVVRR